MLYSKPFRVLQAVNLGTLVGIGVAAWMSNGYLAFCPERSDRAQLIIYGGLVGSAVYKGLRSGMSNFFSLLSDYMRLFEAHVFLKARLIDDREFRALLRHLVFKHFGLNHYCELPTKLREKEAA